MNSLLLEERCPDPDETEGSIKGAGKAIVHLERRHQVYSAIEHLTRAKLELFTVAQFRIQRPPLTRVNPKRLNFGPYQPVMPSK